MTPRQVWEAYCNAASCYGYIVKRNGRLYPAVHLPDSHQRNHLVFQQNEVRLYQMIEGYWRRTASGLEALIQFEEMNEFPPIHEVLGLQILYLDPHADALSEETLC